MAFKFVRDTEIQPFSGSAVFQAGGATATIKTKFKHLTQTQFAEWAGRECAATAPAEMMARHALEVLDSWSEITDESDNALALDLPNVTALFERYPSAYIGCVVGYVRARGTALEKN